jgi:proteasome activator subunit 4
VTYQQLRPIAELLWAIFLRVGGNVHDEADVADSLSFVLKLLNKSPDCPPHGKPERLALPWRPLSDALLKVQMHGISPEEWSVAGPSEIPIGAEARKMHGQALSALIRRARNFFESDAAIEIVKYFKPYLCPHEAGLYRAAGLLCLMIPEYVEESFITDACSLWHSIPNCLEWSYLWTHLFSRLARHNSSMVVPALQSHLPRIFESLLFLLEIPSSKDAAQRPELLTWPPDCSFLVTKTSLKNEIVKKMTRLIVYSLEPQSSTWELLKNLVLYLKPFFHPLNEGGWTSSLDMFLKMLTLNFAKRVGIERGNHRAKRPWTTQSPVSVDEEINFVHLMLPLALTAFESKDYVMSFGAAQALKDLVSLQPDTVLPLVTDRLIPALENSMKPHEALNSMEAFSVILGPLLRSPGGIEHAVIAQMLQQTVLGIDNNDPMKTVKTLRFVSAYLCT